MVAIGDSTLWASRDAKSIVLLAPATATNGAPSGASAGLATSELLFGSMPQSVGLQIYSTAGSGTMSATCQLWGYKPNATGTAKWLPIGAPISLAEIAADTLGYTKPLDLPGHFERLYCEVTAIGGTSTSITAELDVRLGYPS